MTITPKTVSDINGKRKTVRTARELRRETVNFVKVLEKMSFWGAENNLFVFLFYIISYS